MCLIPQAQASLFARAVISSYHTCLGSRSCTAIRTIACLFGGSVLESHWRGHWMEKKMRVVLLRRPSLKWVASNILGSRSPRRHLSTSPIEYQLVYKRLGLTPYTQHFWRREKVFIILSLLPACHKSCKPHILRCMQFIGLNLGGKHFKLKRNSFWNFDKTKRDPW